MGAYSENREFFFLWLLLTYHSFYALMFYCPGFSVGYSKTKSPKEGMGAGASLVPPDLLPLFWNPLFLWQVKGGQSVAAHMGAEGLGFLNKCQAQKFLPETTACVVTPLFLQIGIVYTLINKLYWVLAGCHDSTMEIISERKCVSL